ncbi:fructosamine kinase family protein [Granulosicoccaceae sp. 1_MG-2023]|nr:fructosamine kinase family protein [Granulosicoccaceae sp. 1_MG-2023]
MRNATTKDLHALISTLSDAPTPPAELSPVGGGDTHQAWRLTLRGEAFFLKVNQHDKLPLLRAEAHALQTLHQADSPLHIPRPLACGRCGALAGLLMEQLDISSHGPHGSEAGRALALLHRNTAAYFGFTQDNFIGGNVQKNTPEQDWVRFFAAHRLGFQRDLAAHRGARPGTLRKVDKVIEKLGDFFGDYRPAASLLHGDLWAGNAATLRDGRATLFDPASYYGDRETDLAMSELFGGFSADFYHAYEASWPPDPGYARRRPVYQLYHVLNHFNLFGGHYQQQADALCEQALA